MKIRFTIPRTGDGTGEDKTTFLMRINGVKWTVGTRPNSLGERQLRVPPLDISSRFSKSLDPMTENIAYTIRNLVLPNTKSRRSRYYDYDNSDYEKWTAIITFKRDDGDAMIWIQKNKTVYTMNSQRMSLNDISLALAKIIFRSVVDRSAVSLDEYIDKVTETPPYVMYALENRTPYVFWDGGTRCEVRINTKLVGKNDIALEISEGIWGSMTVSELNTFVNTFGLNSSRSKKWYRISPSRLWTALMGEEPSESQKKLMVAWLLQNRTQKMVEERAYELVYELADEFENIQVVIHEGFMALFVRGIHADWIIADADKGWKRGHQNVNTYYWDGNKWSGPICIDNLHHNSSIGDQLSSRAMMLMNDKGAGEMIYTLRGIQPMVEGWNGKHRYNRVLIPYDKRKDVRYKKNQAGALYK
tara:strand:+ start:3388 stop:4635 length:1248 start_codon:yes stop_codon:yes gene_type:complete